MFVTASLVFSIDKKSLNISREKKRLNLNRLENLFLILFFRFRQLKGTQEIKKAVEEEKTQKLNRNKTLSDKEVDEISIRVSIKQNIFVEMHTVDSNQLFCLGLDFDVQRLFCCPLSEWKKFKVPKKPGETF